MPAQELGGAVHHQVRAVGQGLAQPGGGQGVVHDQGHARLPGDRRQGLEVGHVQLGVAQGLHVDGPGLGSQRPAERLRVAAVGEVREDAQAAEALAEQGVGAPVEVGARHQPFARPQEGEQGQGDGRLPGGRGHRPHPALQRRHPFLQDRHGGVADAGVDVARFFQVEQAGAVLGGIEHVAGGLVDGHRPAPRVPVGAVPPVQGGGLEAVGLGHARLRGEPPDSGGGMVGCALVSPCGASGSVEGVFRSASLR